jgi:CHASE2 domain-containing sensor protein
MADLERRPGRRPTRRDRERRAYQLVVTGGVAGAIFVIGLVLSIAGIFPPEIPVLALIVAVVCFVMFRRNVAR